MYWRFRRGPVLGYVMSHVSTVPTAAGHCACTCVRHSSTAVTTPANTVHSAANSARIAIATNSRRRAADIDAAFAELCVTVSVKPAP